MNINSLYLAFLGSGLLLFCFCSNILPTDPNLLLKEQLLGTWYNEQFGIYLSYENETYHTWQLSDCDLATYDINSIGKWYLEGQYYYYNYLTIYPSGMNCDNGVANVWAWDTLYSTNYPEYLSIPINENILMINTDTLLILSSLNTDFSLIFIRINNTE